MACVRINSDRLGIPVRSDKRLGLFHGQRRRHSSFSLVEPNTLQGASGQVAGWRDNRRNPALENQEQGPPKQKLQSKQICQG